MYSNHPSKTAAHPGLNKINNHWPTIFFSKSLFGVCCYFLICILVHIFTLSSACKTHTHTREEGKVAHQIASCWQTDEKKQNKTRVLKIKRRLPPLSHFRLTPGVNKVFLSMYISAYCRPESAQWLYGISPMDFCALSRSGIDEEGIYTVNIVSESIEQHFVEYWGDK